MNDRQNERYLTSEVLETHAKNLGYAPVSEQYSYWLIGVCPTHDWPGRDLVDLDNMGAASYWLHDAICGDGIELLSDSSADDCHAEMLAEAYVRRLNEFGVYYSSDFDSDEDCHNFQKVLIDEFRSMIAAWRTAVLESLERAEKAQ